MPFFDRESVIPNRNSKRALKMPQLVVVDPAMLSFVVFHLRSFELKVILKPDLALAKFIQETRVIFKNLRPRSIPGAANE